jgi:hypothetical protein
LDGRLREQDAFLGRALERRAVEVALAEVFVPRVGMSVELDERERPVLRREDAQFRKGDGVVSAERGREDARIDDRRQRLLDLPVRALGVAG